AASAPEQSLAGLLETLSPPWWSSEDDGGRPEADALARGGRRGAGTYAAPRDALETQLQELWEKVLGVSPVGIKDNFFDLGGHSLPAVRLFTEIEKVLGKRLPLATLFHAPTVEQMATHLRGEESSDGWSSLVPVQPEGSRPPFFGIHAGSGNVLFYRDLARRLGPDQPFYGLQAQGLDGKRPRHTRVEDMAAHYIREMRRLQPEGPYFFGGGSFGGLVSFEIAQQLRAQGQKVALVALFDTHGPGYPKPLPTTSAFRRKLYDLWGRIDHHAGNLHALDWKGRLTYVEEKRRKARVMAIRAYKKRLERLARKLHVIPPNTLPGPLQQTESAIRQCAQNYVPRVYPGRVTLFRASKQPQGIYPDPELGWGGLASGGLEIHEVPGHHGSMLSAPRVETLAEQLTACLDKARASVGAETGAEPVEVDEEAYEYSAVS
ncbi:MAG: thioesterase domain-containing protein, partial [Pyrinomonadaceae bacterium]